jgi:hypothetical protein
MNNHIDVLATPQRANPPSKLVTDNRGSKYDVFFETALSNPNEWFLVASAPISARQTVYSTASAIRSGRLGNMPEVSEGRFEIIVRRVDENNESFSNMYMRYSNG